MNKLKVSLIFAIIFLTATVHQVSGRCIRRYGHSCLGGHGKRSQVPAINAYDVVLSRSLPPSRPMLTNSRDQLPLLPLRPYGMSAADMSDDEGDLSPPLPQMDFDLQHGILFQKLARMNGPYTNQVIEDDEDFKRK